MNKELLLQMNNISKTFLGVKALSDVDFSMGYGEIHGLMGENGAGKSTLIKILTGLYHKDKTSGSIIFDNREINLHTPLQAQNIGISTIYQEINLVEYLSVSENIYLGREVKNRGVIDWSLTHEKAGRLLEEMGIRINVKEPLYKYGAAIQQMVAIARAISIEAKLLVMDEPTSSLDNDEVKILFKVIDKLKNKGISIIFISHRIDEIFQITDKLTILKDGRLVGEYKTSELSKLELVSKMIGRDAGSLAVERKSCRQIDDDILCELKNIKQGTRITGMNIYINRGEIVGLAGLLGAGRTETAKILFGDTQADSGVIEIDGKEVKFKLPKNAISNHFAFCSEDRKIEGIIPQMSVMQNITLANLKSLSRRGVISSGKEKAAVEEFMESLQIKASGMNQKIETLSGGNQQKVLLGRWLCTKPDFIILDEPTRGIDVGAKAEIEKLIQKMASEGISVLMISSELEELVRGCDRVVVIRDGKNIGELCGEEITEENIMAQIAKEHVLFAKQ